MVVGVDDAGNHILDVIDGDGFDVIHIFKGHIDTAAWLGDVWNVRLSDLVVK